jgi:hypothetical protein
LSVAEDGGGEILQRRKGITYSQKAKRATKKEKGKKSHDEPDQNANSYTNLRLSHGPLLGILRHC